MERDHIDWNEIDRIYRLGLALDNAMQEIKSGMYGRSVAFPILSGAAVRYRMDDREPSQYHHYRVTVEKGMS